MNTPLSALLAAAACWLGGDLLYSRWVLARLSKWEARVERDEQGVCKGCREYTVGQGEPALLLIHGINDSPAAYYKMAPRMAGQRLTCRAMRLPGFAEPIGRYAASNWRQWSTAVQSELAALRQDHQRVSLVAHSLGAAVAIAYLLEHPEAVDKAVLLAPALAVSNRRSPLLSVRTWHEMGQRVLLFSRITETPFPNDVHAPDEQDYPWRQVFTPREIFQQTFQLLDHIHNRARQFRVPLFLALSRQDQVIDWQAAEQFYQQAASPTKRIRFMEDAGHALTIDNGWDTLTDEIVQFVRQP